MIQQKRGREIFLSMIQVIYYIVNRMMLMMSSCCVLRTVCSVWVGAAVSCFFNQRRPSEREMSEVNEVW